MVIAYFFDNLFNSPSLTVKLYERCLYAIGTTQKDRKRMPEMSIDRKMKTDDFGYLYANELDCCTWLERHSVAILFSMGGVELIDQSPEAYHLD